MTILLVVFVQSVILSVGWWVVYNATSERISLGVQKIILDNNRMVAESLVDSIGVLPNEFNPNDPSWERAQAAVDQVQFGSGGFACILDANGQIVCHPEIEDPGIRSMNLSERQVDVFGDNLEKVNIMSSGADGIASGIVDFGADGKHYIATKHISDDGSQLLVHQPVSGISSAVNTINGGLLSKIILSGAIVVGFSALTIGVLMHRHGCEMSRWNRELEQKVKDRTADVRRSRETIVLALAKITEYRDNETGEHVDRISAYSARVARELMDEHDEITEQWVEQIRLASTLHDIGKVAIPDAVLCKPGKLTQTEFEQIKRHPVIGADTLIAVHHELKDDPLVAMAVEICLYHHERWDGGGYPTGIASEDIPLSARIVAVVDVFDALMSPRVYKPAMPVEKVFAIIRESSGSHFDPDVVDAFFRCADELVESRKDIGSSGTEIHLAA